MSGSSKRIFGLDFYRALAVLFVLVAHSFYLAYPDNNQPINRFFGFFGVEIFFVLSGFLIGTILIKTYAVGGGKFNFSQAKVFWIRRWFRTLPNYYFTLFFYILLFNVYTPDGVLSFTGLLKYGMFFQNAITPHPGFFAVAWSLSIEEWFYLLFPLVLLTLNAFTGKLKTKVFLITVVLFLVGCLTLRFGMTMHSSLVDWGSVFRKMIFWRLDAIAYGVLFAWIKFKNQQKWIERSSKWKYLVVGGFLLLGCSIHLWDSYFVNGNADLFLKTVFFSVNSFALACFLPWLDGWKNSPNRILGKCVEHLSLISYSLYLNHWLILLILANSDFTKNWGGMVQIMVLWGSTIMLSTLQYYYFEQPITKLRERFSPKEDYATVT